MPRHHETDKEKHLPRRHETDKEKRSPAPSVKRPKRNTVFYRKKPKRRTDFSPGISKRCTDFHLNRPQHSTGFFPGSPERCTGFSPTPCGRQKDTRPGVSFLSGIFRFFACRIFFVQPFCIVLPFKTVLAKHTSHSCKLKHETLFRRHPKRRFLISSVKSLYKWRKIHPPECRRCRPYP